MKRSVAKYFLKPTAPISAIFGGVTFCQFVTELSTGSGWFQKKFGRALKELSIGVQNIEIRLKKNLLK